MDEDDANPRQVEGGAAGVRLLFKTVVHRALIFRSETWVFTHRMGKALGGFQTQVVRRLMGQLLWRKPYEKWTYTLAETAK